MRVLSRLILAACLFMIFGFCVFGFLATYQMPGEAFCRGMYMVLILLSGVCVTQVIQPISQRA
jgi:hypothetical protein